MSSANSTLFQISDEPVALNSVASGTFVECFQTTWLKNVHAKRCFLAANRCRYSVSRASSFRDYLSEGRNIYSDIGYSLNVSNVCGSRKIICPFAVIQHNK